MDRTTKRLAWVGIVAAWVPLGMGARGCGPATSMSPAPDVNGRWAVSYDDSLAVRVEIGGAVYDATVPAEGGTVEVEHGGATIQFELDCARPEVVCPSEAFPAEVTASQREPAYPHRMWVTIPGQTCSGEMVAPAQEECGEGTPNPDCEMVCAGEIVTADRDTFGLIDEPGERFDLLLGADVASNGVNCVLLGVSSAHADIVSTGTAAAGDWTAQSFESGEIVTAYAGGCLWANVTEDEELEALVLGASVRFTTGFTAVRAE